MTVFFLVFMQSQYKHWDIIRTRQGHWSVYSGCLNAHWYHVSHPQPPQRIHSHISKTKCPIYCKDPKSFGWSTYKHTHLLQKDKQRQACANINTMHTLIKATTFLLLGGRADHCLLSPVSTLSIQDVFLSELNPWNAVFPSADDKNYLEKKHLRRQKYTRQTIDWLHCVNTYTHMHI